MNGRLHARANCPIGVGAVIGYREAKIDRTENASEEQDRDGSDDGDRYGTAQELPGEVLSHRFLAVDGMQASGANHAILYPAGSAMLETIPKLNSESQGRTFNALSPPHHSGGALGEVGSNKRLIELGVHTGPARSRLVLIFLSAVRRQPGRQLRREIGDVPRQRPLALQVDAQGKRHL